MLTSSEKELLIKQIEANIKTYKITLIIGYVLILVIIGIFIVPACYVAISNQKKKINQINEGSLEIKQVKGILKLKNVGYKGPTYAILIDGNLVPGDTLSKNDPSSIQNHVGEAITVEYVPSISKNRSYTDSQGHGYNFINKTTS
jgi:hypothetical protein